MELRINCRCGNDRQTNQVKALVEKKIKSLFRDARCVQSKKLFYLHTTCAVVLYMSADGKVRYFSDIPKGMAVVETIHFCEFLNSWNPPKKIESIAAMMVKEVTKGMDAQDRKKQNIVYTEIPKVEPAGYKVDLSWIKGEAREVVSDAIQKELFKLKYCWGVSEKRVQYTKDPYLYIEEDMRLAYGNSESKFESYKEREITVNDILSGRFGETLKRVRL